MENTGKPEKESKHKKTQKTEVVGLLGKESRLLSLCCQESQRVDDPRACLRVSRPLNRYANNEQLDFTTTIVCE